MAKKPPPVPPTPPQQPVRIRQGSRAHLYMDEWQADRGLTDEQVAGRVGVARNTIWRWKNEQNRLDPEKIARFADALGLDPPDLWHPPAAMPEPTRPSIDAILDGAPDDLHETVFDLARRLTRRAS